MLYGSCTIGIYNNDAVLCVFTQDSRSRVNKYVEMYNYIFNIKTTACRNVIVSVAGVYNNN